MTHEDNMMNILRFMCDRGEVAPKDIQIEGLDKTRIKTYLRTLSARALAKSYGGASPTPRTGVKTPIMVYPTAAGFKRIDDLDAKEKA